MRFKKIIIGIISLFSICSCTYVEPDNSTKTLIDCPDPSELISRPAEFCDVQVPAIDEKFEEDYHREVRFYYEKYNGFGEKANGMSFCPTNYSIKDNKNMNRAYKIENIPDECKSMKDEVETWFPICEKEPICGDIDCLLRKPI